jgi:hypothetical protein
MVDAESILDLIPSKQKQRIPKLGDTNEANRFNSCPDYKRVSYSKKTGKTGILGCVGSSPTEEETPDGEIGRRTGHKNGNPHLVR